jgi:hypothetical protein
MDSFCHYVRDETVIEYAHTWEIVKIMKVNVDRSKRRMNNESKIR